MNVNYQKFNFNVPSIILLSAFWLAFEKFNKKFINCCYRTKLWQKSLLVWNMLTFNNTTVNIKEEDGFFNITVNIKEVDGFFVRYESETISGKAKNCMSPILLEVKSLWWLKISESKSICAWTTCSLITTNEGRSSTVKGFVTAKELGWLWSALKFISMDFQRETFLINENHIEEKLVYCGLDLGYFLYHLQLVSQIWALQNASLQKSVMKPSTIFTVGT